jgi:hypothetical protein
METRLQLRERAHAIWFAADLSVIMGSGSQNFSNESKGLSLAGLNVRRQRPVYMQLKGLFKGLWAFGLISTTLPDIS